GHSGAERVRFAGEATRLTLAVSPALPSLFEVGLVPAAACHSLEVAVGAPFLALEWMEGTALAPQALHDAERSTLALIVARDMGRALADLHGAGLAHGDVKPHNVLFHAATKRAR